MDNEGNNNQQNGENEDLDNLELYSDDTKIVFNFNDIYQIVYYYSGNEITGLEWYYNYEDRTTASYAIASIKAGLNDTDVESVTQNGKYVVVKFKESEYEGLTLEQVKTTFAYLEEIKKNSSN